MIARPVAPAVLASLAALAFVLFNGLLIAQGQFDEDAYILFVYVENILDGSGVAYYPGGPRAEGATDFLWMLMLVGLGSLGVSVGAAAIALNAVGVWLITYLLATELAAEPLRRTAYWALLPLTVLWVASDPLEAAVGGFSVYLYCSLVLLAFVWLYRQIYLDALPLLAIVIALFRPDGVIIGVTTVLIGFIVVLRQGRSPRRYLLSSVVALAIGVGYFIWRYRYFGNLLPLPLYVKGAGGGGALAGLAGNLEWLENYRFMLLPLLLLMLAWGRGRLAALALYALPVIGLFLALLAATQSQNIGYRFQAPLFIVLYFVFLVGLIDAFRHPPVAKLAGLAYLLFTPALLQHAVGNVGDAAHRTTRQDYVSRFSVQLPCLLPPASRIALTEAGKLTYWSSPGGFEIVDLVGLNTEYTAKHPLDGAYLDGLAPDLLMFWLTEVVPRAGAPRVRLLEPAEIRALASGGLADGSLAGESGGEESSRGTSKVDVASIVATRYLADHPERYDVWLVDWLNKGLYHHVFALRRGLDADGRFGQALQASVDHPDNLPHFEALRQRDRASCT